MTDTAIAQMIREVLVEELGKIRSGASSQGAQQRLAVREELVSISNDSELDALVRRILTLASNTQDRQALERGELVFRLAGQRPTGPAQVGTPASAVAAGATTGAVEILSGIVSERQVDRLPAGTTRVRVSKAVRLTPLAKDRLRKRKIAIERMES